MQSKRRVLGVVLVVLVVAMAGCGAASGPEISAENVWARPSMAAPEGGTGTVSGVFMTLMNSGKEHTHLIGGKTDVAEVVEIHETIIEGDKAKMQKMADGLEVPGEGQVELKPGSYHVMLINLNRDLKPGDKFALELQFDEGDPLTVEAEVKMP
jgi:periplasmic copper chaperone A